MSVGCILAALLIAYISIIPGAQSALTDSSENNMLDLAKSYIKILDNSISAVNETATYMSSDPDFYNCLMQNGESYLVATELKQYLRDNSSYTRAEIYNKNGEFITSSESDSQGEDAPYYVNAVLSTGLPAQSDIVTDGVEKPSVICAVPLSNSGSLFGVVCITVPVDILTSDFGELKLQGIESSFAYLISPQGYFIYHPEDEYIGKITGNDIIRGFLEQGNVASAIGNFTFENSEKVIGLATSEKNNWMLVIQANKAELLKPINDLMILSLVILLIALVVLAAVVYGLSVTITRPIKILTKGINNIAELDFRDNEKVQTLGKRSDETGEMSRALNIMQSNIKDIIGKINDASVDIGNSSELLNDIATSLNDCASDNSAVSEELAAGMEQTSVMAANIKSEVEHIKNKTIEISKKSQETITQSKDIVERADQAKVNTEKSALDTKQLYDEVSKEAKVALEQSKAVQKIQELTQNIMNIADQTGLLALNASIEAARSGEYGKGFAVVANEISHLATQSADTVADIVDIVSEVTVAVENIDKCLNKALSFIEHSVMKDYDNFMVVSGKYNEDATSFSDTIKEICTNIDELETATNQIVDAISGINQTINEASEGINGIAERATDVVSLSGDTYNKVQDNKNMADMLEEIVDKFTLQ
ncbi:MAG: methyl-accepting chemotaxis protein [Lachnospiraceae bacterium]|nr:methyl-accepting chemotaxis protein [Lachnospiraceae bacterium]